ncbi:hypothetical protein DB29_02398 [Shouchella clausii]|nr:hypothetical protein DB29_02398 [Shouchella clausii]
MHLDDASFFLIIPEAKRCHGSQNKRQSRLGKLQKKRK